MPPGLTESEKRRLGITGVCWSTHTTFFMSSKLGSLGTTSKKGGRYSSTMPAGQGGGSEDGGGRGVHPHPVHHGRPGGTTRLLPALRTTGGMAGGMCLTWAPPGRWQLAVVPLGPALAPVQHQPHYEYQLQQQLRYQPLALWPPPFSTWWSACQLAQLISA